MKASDITVVSAEVPQSAAQPLADWLAEQEIFASTWEDREGGPSRVEIFLEDPAGADDAAASIVAAKLGFQSVSGIDNDEDAVRIAGENAAANGVEATFQTQDLAVCDLQATVVVNAPVDISSVECVGCFEGGPVNPLYLIHREAMRVAGVKRLVEKGDAPSVGMTEHTFGDGRTLVVAVNYDSTPIRCPFTSDGRLGAVHRGRVTDGTIDFDGNDVAVFEVRLRAAL